MVVDADHTLYVRAGRCGTLTVSNGTELRIHRILEKMEKIGEARVWSGNDSQQSWPCPYLSTLVTAINGAITSRSASWAMVHFAQTATNGTSVRSVAAQRCASKLSMLSLACYSRIVWGIWRFAQVGATRQRTCGGSVHWTAA